MDEPHPAAPGGPWHRAVSCHGYAFAGYAPGRHRGLPSPTLTLVVPIDEPLVLLDAAGRPVSHAGVLAGLHTTPATIVHPGHQRGVQVALHPLAARALLGVPAAALGGDAHETADVLGARGREMTERVAAAADDAARVAIVHDVLARAVDAGYHRVTPEVRRAWARLAGGGVAVARVADEVGWSARHLERRLRAEVGVGPRTVARLARFDRTRLRLAARARAGRPLALAALAADAGYADQSHLTREFTAFAGCSPTRWVREEVTDGIAGPAPADGPEPGSGTSKTTGPGTRQDDRP